jgi:hypothetical protein
MTTPDELRALARYAHSSNHMLAMREAANQLEDLERIVGSERRDPIQGLKALNEMLLHECKSKACPHEKVLKELKS